jgi:hypothetical protein
MPFQPSESSVCAIPLYLQRADDATPVHQRGVWDLFVYRCRGLGTLVVCAAEAFLVDKPIRTLMQEYPKNG